MENSLINQFERSKESNKLSIKRQFIHMKKKMAEDVYRLKTNTMMLRLYTINQSKIKADEEEREYLSKEEHDQLENLRIEIKWHATKMYEMNEEEKANDQLILNL